MQIFFTNIVFLLQWVQVFQRVIQKHRDVCLAGGQGSFHRKRLVYNKRAAAPVIVMIFT